MNFDNPNLLIQKKSYLNNESFSKNIVPNTNDKLIQKTRFSNENNKYDPYIDYLQKNGLLEENNKVRITTKYINVDSSARNLNPSFTKSDEILLEQDSMYYSDSLLNIIIPNHNYNKNDKIMIDGIETSNVSIKTLYTDDDNLQYYYSIIFVKGSNGLIFKTNYDTSVYFDTDTKNYVVVDSPDIIKNNFTSFYPNFVVGDGISLEDLQKYDNSDMYVSLSGFINSNIGNIPINFLNSTHKVYFTNPDGSDNVYINIPNGSNVVEKITGFYIKLLSEFEPSDVETEIPLDIDTFKNMVIKMKFEYIGGIPINKLNVGLPISNENVNGYYYINNTTKNTISINLYKKPYYLLDNQPIKFGGNNVYIFKVSDINGGYLEPNNYSIELNETIRNVFMIKLISSNFPKIQRNVINGYNNKIYWENIEDGNIIYCASIDDGNYNEKMICSLLETSMYNIPRKNMENQSINLFNYYVNQTDPHVLDIDLNNHLGEITNNNPLKSINKGGYTNKIIFKICIDKYTGNTSFKSFKEANIRRPIIKVYDENDNSPPSDISIQYEPPYTIKIVHPFHGLSIGDKIIFENFISTFGIPENVLNTEHTISNISSINTYEIIIDNFNLLNDRTSTYGGYTAKILVPIKFRLLFNYHDTIGKQLGFRNVGNDLSITNFDYEITNDQPYQNETIVLNNITGLKYVDNGTKQLVLLQNNELNLNMGQYLYLVIKEFGDIMNVSNLKNIRTFFAKIYFNEDVDESSYFTYDMFNLSKLTISIYDSNGKLYNSHGLEHSFMLEISSLNLLPLETGINPNGNIL